MIKVSEITLYHRCPRMCYFVSRGDELTKNKSCEYVERMILKELALSYCSVYNSHDKLLTHSVSGVRSCLDNISLNLSSNRDFYANDSFQIEPVLRSEKFGLTG